MLRSLGAIAVQHYMLTRQELVEDGIPIPPENMTTHEHIDWCITHALIYFDKGELDKAVMLFFELVQTRVGTSWIAYQMNAPTSLYAAGQTGDRHIFERAMARYKQ